MRAMVRFLLIVVGLFAATTFAARPANFGLSDGDEGSGGAPALQDLFKSGPGAAPKPTPNAASQMNDPGLQPSLAVAPPGPSSSPIAAMLMPMVAGRRSISRSRRAAR